MSCLSEEEDYLFFDTHEDIVSVKSDCFDITGPKSPCPYSMWIGSPGTVEDRRSKFRDWMELDSTPYEQNQNQSQNRSLCNMIDGINRIRESSGTVLRTSASQDEFFSSHSSLSCRSNDSLDLSEKRELKEAFTCTEPILEGQMEYDNVVEVGMAPNKLITEKEIMDRSKMFRLVKKFKKRWCDKLRPSPCLPDIPSESESLVKDISRVRRLKVKQYRKKAKELSALYKGQNIQAHEGSILAMKFSPNGRYLASAGEDRVVRVWQIMEDERSNERDIPELDPSCMYFELNNQSELKPLTVDKYKMGKLSRTTADSACVVLPPKFFQISGKPVHEFCGHSGDILDLSWSKNNYLLSSSVDKTVRLWRVTCDVCLGVFSHSNYVTCVHFNPVDDNFFISGSIDGKVRIWEISGCHVIDWTDINDFVTAVCYRPDGKGGIIGSLRSGCRYYTILENRLQLDAPVHLYSKKKAPSKRITGFEFFPHDPSKVLVTSADSQVRILHGFDVIGSYKGTGNQLSASFTLDGKHIISASEDSSVCLWNCVIPEEAALPQVKNTKSYEWFLADASIAIPWRGFQSENSGVSIAPPFSLRQEFLLDSSSPRRTATWPVEHLPSCAPFASSSLNKAQCKFLKTSFQSASDSHAWGLVIVTAGWDGRIRSFLSYGLPAPL